LFETAAASDTNCLKFTDINNVQKLLSMSFVH